MEFVDRADTRPGSIPLARCRGLLGEEAEALTDEEVALIRRHAETMTYMVVEMYLKHHQTLSRNRASETRLARAREWV